jgi:hypothetical protein
MESIYLLLFPIGLSILFFVFCIERYKENYKHITSNKITFNGRTLNFEVKYYRDSFLDKTNFYEGYETLTFKKWQFFGETMTKQVPKYVFTINSAITNEHLSKDFWERELNEKIKILERKEEIERKEFV